MDTVVVNGVRIMEGGCLLTANEEEILQNAQKMADDLVTCIREG